MMTDPTHGPTYIPLARRKLFGANLKIARRRARLSQAKFAERLGLRQQSISLFEGGHEPLTVERATSLAQAVGATLQDLMNEAGG